MAVRIGIDCSEEGLKSVPREYKWSAAELAYRTTLPITSQMHKVLQRIARKCKQRGGRTLAHSEICRALIQVVLVEQGKNLKLSGVRSEDDLAAAIRDLLLRRK